MTKEEINTPIKNITETNEISDGYHTFGDLYEHRIQLFIALCKMITFCKMMSKMTKHHEKEIDWKPIWKSKKHSDGSEFSGWFILGIEKEHYKQITYHIPVSEWEECEFAVTLEKAPDFDGHTSFDVIERLKNLV